MKYYEFCVIKTGVVKDGVMYGSYNRKQDAIDVAKKLREKYPDEDISIKAHVYSKPLDAWDVGNYYLYSYDVNF